MNAKNLKLVSAEATQVLGEYDHRITFNEEDEFVIIYGPNGVGKTKFLEIIHAMLRLDGRTLTRMPFGSATLGFSDGTELIVSGDDVAGRTSTEKRRIVRNLRFAIRRRGRETEPWTFTGDSFADWIIENTSWRQYESQGFWEDLRDGELVTQDELQSRFPEAVGESTPMPPTFRAFRRLVSSYLIETQRLRIQNEAFGQAARFAQLSPGSRRKNSSKIAELAGKMRSLVKDAQTEHSTITQQLDRTFPNRVLEGFSTTSSAEAVRQRYEEQNAFRSRLGRVASVELAEALALPERTLQEWELRLLDLYLDDAAAKLAPFETMIQKIELLEQILNTRLLRKRLKVTAKDGLLVQHEDGRTINLDSLSSGEQHEIILMFDLLFNVPRGSLVMIDEPEISLHVVWQLTFIPDVQRIADLAGFRFIVATHSPQIINDAWHQAVPLGPSEERFT